MAEAGPCAPQDTAEDQLRELDRRLRGRYALITGGQSPWAALQAWEDWLFHLSVSPARQLELLWRWSEALGQLAAHAGQTDPENWAFRPEAGDRRFRSAGWAKAPYHMMAQAHLAAEAQWNAATSCLRGVASHHERRVAFMGDSALNAFAPVNFPLTNPDVLEAALNTRGQNFQQGLRFLLGDMARLARGATPEAADHWQLGETMAATRGEVVFRNNLFELIRYAPLTEMVHPEPVLIVPAWIMKYYILDLTPEESFVRWLTEQGYQVFIMSWKNPGPEFSETAFDDYRREGVMAALDAVQDECGEQPVHGVGYCLGGTVLSIAAAVMSRNRDARLASLTLLAAQTDFREAGELLLFIDESQVALLEDMMHVEGVLDARRMSGAFSMLRAHDMIYAKMVDRYFLGKDTSHGALDAWLADATRMPARMHSEYLRLLFLENRFTHGQMPAGGYRVAVKDIRVPVFALGAERDHIAPWQSVYRIALHSAADVKFVLTGGGHNTSVVSPPGKRGAYYFTAETIPATVYLEPDAWLDQTERQEGSWWPEWLAWLKQQSRETPPVPAPTLRRGQGPAPGRYAFER